MKQEQQIVPCLWFDNQAEEAIQFYASVFRDAKTGNITRYGKEGPGQEGSALTVEFELMGSQFVALNGGPHFKFTEAISLTVKCGNQQEIDYYWEKLSEGGQKSQCGWLKDKYGLSWQVAPVILAEMLRDADKEKASRAMQAMMKMSKIDIGILEKAYNNQ